MSACLETEYEKILANLPIDKLQNRTFLITGANGLIGSYLVDFLVYLNKKYQLNIKIYAMSRSMEKLQKRFVQQPNLILMAQDLNLPIKQDIKADYIIHAASNAHPKAFSTDPVGTMKTNLLGTINLLEMARKYNTHFLYISTGEIYGNNVDHAFTEKDLGLVDTKIARSCYPESKRAAETLCISYHDQYQVKVNIARLCYVYGAQITETNSRADAQFLRAALNGEPIVLKSTGTQRRTYCYIADATSAILTILLKGENGEVYNVSNLNSVVSVKQYAECISQMAGVPLKFELPDEIEAKGYSKPADSILDSSKLKSLGWTPLYDIQHGMEQIKQLKITCDN